MRLWRWPHGSAGIRLSGRAAGWRWPLAANSSTLDLAMLGFGLLGGLWTVLIVVGLVVVLMYGGCAMLRVVKAWAVPSAVLMCQGADAIDAALREHGVVYVLTERLVGYTPEALRAMGAQLVAAFSRPGDAPNAPGLTLWRIGRDTLPTG